MPTVSFTDEQIATIEAALRGRRTRIKAEDAEADFAIGQCDSALVALRAPVEQPQGETGVGYSPEYVKRRYEVGYNSGHAIGYEKGYHVGRQGQPQGDVPQPVQGLDFPDSPGWWCFVCKDEEWVRELDKWELTAGTVTYKWGDSPTTTTQSRETFGVLYEGGKWWRLIMPWDSQP